MSVVDNVVLLGVSTVQVFCEIFPLLFIQTGQVLRRPTESLPTSTIASVIYLLNLAVSDGTVISGCAQDVAIEPEGEPGASASGGVAGGSMNSMAVSLAGSVRAFAQIYR